MKNIAIVNTVVDGSTGKIAHGLHNKLIKNGYNSFFCYGYGKRIENPRFYRIENGFSRIVHALLTRLFGGQGSYSTGPTKKLIKFLKDNRIDTIYLISAHGYYLNEKYFFKKIKEQRIKIIYIMIDEYPYVGKCAYKGDCNNFIKGCGNCPCKHDYPSSLFFDKSKKIFANKLKQYSNYKDLVFVGPEYVINEFKKSPLSVNQKSVVLDEAIDLDVYQPRDTNNLIRSLGIDSKKRIILCVAPLNNKRKGCEYFIELSKRFINNDEFFFIHVGNNKKNNLFASNFLPIGFIKNQELLTQYYSMADLFVFPSLMDTMPNACLESLACGTPILCFNTSGMPYLTDNVVGNYVEPRNVDELYKIVKGVDKKTPQIINCCRNYAKKRYDMNNYYNNLIYIGNSFEMKNNQGD